MKVYGKISDTSGLNLGSATITMVNGTQANKFGTISNLDGNFSLENDIIDENSLFEIAFNGLEPQTLTTAQLQGDTVVLMDEIESENQSVSLDKNNLKPLSIKANSGLSIKKSTLLIIGTVLIVGLYLTYKRKQLFKN